MILRRLLFLLFLPITAFSQLYINDQLSVEDMVLKLQGDGVKIENVTYYMPLENDTTLLSPVGSFVDNIGILGMESGLLMTNGAARFALGPNDRSDKYQANYFDVFDDPDLQQLIEPGQTIQDLCVIEFDISIYGDYLTFNYVFGSEEYPEFLEFNDVFGFFISGPGIAGSENLALIPGTTIPVSVSNINHTRNTQYYVGNGTGTTPFDNSELQYDGRTVVLKAERQVTPCEVYHIKLAIADVNDSNLDSGVFLEEGSFSSRKLPNYTVSYEHNRFDYMIEGCNDVIVTVHREGLEAGQSLSLDMTVEGTATEGIDFNNLPDRIVFGPDDETVSFVINALMDTINDPEEVITLVLQSHCDKFPEFSRIDIPLKEWFTLNLPEIEKCGPGEITLNPDPVLTDSYTWQDPDYISCLTCASPVVDLEENYLFQFTVYDSVSTCPGKGSQQVTYRDVRADFDVFFDECLTSIDAQFVNQSENANTYKWDFGDGSTSSAQQTSHRYEAALNETEAQYYTITLTATNAEFGCSNVHSEDIVILEPLFVPNVITPNGDLKNDDFLVNGIHANCWTFIVYNRWGKKVFEEQPFRNRFSPTELSDGTYFFSLENDQGDRLLKGYFEIRQ